MFFRFDNLKQSVSTSVTAKVLRLHRCYIECVTTNAPRCEVCYTQTTDRQETSFGYGMSSDNLQLATMKLILALLRIN